MVPAVSQDLRQFIQRLKARTEAGRLQFSEGYRSFADRHELMGWEGWFSPYADAIYEAVLAHIGPEDVVLDIGAGDLRLALRMAERAQRVYAVEVNPLVVAQALGLIGLDLPRSVHIICANALDLSIPTGVTVAVLLMRHCHHFDAYVDRLTSAGCPRLLTNARWRAGVEVIDLTARAAAFEDVREGWYACRCGATGYVGTGASPDSAPVEVVCCPSCSG